MDLDPDFKNPDPELLKKNLDSSRSGSETLDFCSVLDLIQKNAGFKNPDPDLSVSAFFPQKVPTQIFTNL